jgi:soluble lytic murein transglycosylase
MLDKVLFLMLAGVFSAGAAADLEQQRALFVQAEQALNQGRTAEARRLAEGLPDYPLQPYLRARILSVDPGAADEIPAFLERYGQTRHAAPLRRKWLDILAQRESWNDFVHYYRDTDSKLETRCHYYWALHELGRQPEAYAGAERLWAAGEPAPAACDRLLAAWRATPGFTVDQVWKRFGAALDKNRVELASGLGNLLPEQYRVVAEFWLKVHEHPERVADCASWDRNEPVHGRIFAHGIVRLAAREPLRALGLWNLRRGEFSIEREEQARVDRRLGLALAAGRHPEAGAQFGALAKEAADGEVRASRVRSALWRQDWPEALVALEQLDPAERQQTAWRYWRARALEALDETDEATGIYRQLAETREFYGFAAADRLGRDYALSFTTLPVAEAELASLAESEALWSVREFRALNRPGEAQKEWLHLIQDLPRRDLAVAAHLAERWDWHRLAILTATKAGQWDDLALRFPLAYSEPVMDYARERQLDPALVYGLIRRESAFDPSAKSPVGALGLMQLMPKTGEEVARRLNDTWRSERSLLDPSLNVRYGTAYFRGLLDRFGGHPALAAAAYNAGPGRVGRWLPTDGPRPADIWIEAIPLAETRQYVAAVLGHEAIYRRRLGDAPLRISDLLLDIPPGTRAENRPDRPVPVPVCR